VEDGEGEEVGKEEENRRAQEDGKEEDMLGNGEDWESGIVSSVSH
jgi:hypothetical protein